MCFRLEVLKKSLVADFDARRHWHANRASAIFPVHIRPQCDLRILALNYWRLKNNINQLSVVYRLYNEQGNLVNRIANDIVDNHNDFSVKTMIVEENFDGMLEVEYNSREFKICFSRYCSPLSSKWLCQHGSCGRAY